MAAMMPRYWASDASPTAVPRSSRGNQRAAVAVTALRIKGWAAASPHLPDKNQGKAVSPEPLEQAEQDRHEAARTQPGPDSLRIDDIGGGAGETIR